MVHDQRADYGLRSAGRRCAGAESCSGYRNMRDLELWNLVRDMLSDLDDAGVTLTCEDQPRIKEMKIEASTI